LESEIGSGGGAVVVLEQPAKTFAAVNLTGREEQNAGCFTFGGIGKWKIANALVRAFEIVVFDELLDDVGQVSFPQDQEVVETLHTQGLRESLGVRVHVRRARTHPLHDRVFALEDAVESLSELLVSVDDQSRAGQFPILHLH
jgi:hypothetical protein